MIDYQRYISGLRKCAKEHENDKTLTGHIIVSDLCWETADLLEAIMIAHVLTIIDKYKANKEEQ